jgi:hypothetical protein
MLSNCNYNKVRLLHDLSRIDWYLKKHAKRDAKKEKHKECHDMCVALEKDIEKHIDQIKKALAKKLK